MHIARLAREWAEEAVQRIAAAQLDPCLFNLGHVSGFIVQVGHADLDVDGRLGEQAGNGRRSDVLDPQRGACEATLQAIAPPLVRPGQEES